MSDHQWGGLPEARVKRDGMRPVPAQVGRAMRDWLGPGPRTQVMLGYVAGLWPLLIVATLAIVLVWTAGMHGSP
ncbi:MAG TPA: hypothetical protein VL172_04250 [Kofleriaceae bacterium]|jgi:hypothetical protein|nr:hypothetical protein [Kofleriaceae bacterium]